VAKQQENEADNLLRAPDLKPELAIRVGFVGHRDLTGVDVQALRSRLAAVLRTIKNQLDTVQPNLGYADTKPVCFLVNSLAEGADQLAAEVAVQSGIGYRLRCPIPFETAVYKDRFQFDAKDAWVRFDRLTMDPELDTAVIMLDCPHATPDERRAGYAAAAHLLLENSDVLVAVMDPEHPTSGVGTHYTVQRAEQMSVPIVHIDPRNPDTVKVIVRDENGVTYTLGPEVLAQQIMNIIAPHEPKQASRFVAGRFGYFGRLFADADPVLARERHEEAKKAEQRTKREVFFREPPVHKLHKARSAAFVLRLLYVPWWGLVHWLGISAVGMVDTFGRLLNRPCGLREQACKAEHSSEDNEPVVAEIRRLQGAYSRQLRIADHLAVFYLELYRGSFSLNFMLGPVAVLCALLSYFNPHNEPLWLTGEIIALFIIAFNFAADRIWKWHERGIDYRFLAENFRQMVWLAPLLRVTPLTRMPAHNSFGDPDATWMNWYFRAVLRRQGLVGIREQGQAECARELRLNPHYLSAVKSLLQREWLEGQQIYHAGAARRFRYINYVIRTLNIGLFVTTVSVCLVHIHHVTADERVSVVDSALVVGDDPENQTQQQDAHEAATSVSGSAYWREGALLTILVAVLPAFLAAFHGLSAQGEFERLAERSEAMAEHLQRVAERFRNLGPEEGATLSVILGDRAVDIARMMLEELLEWRVMYLAHATELT